MAPGRKKGSETGDSPEPKKAMKQPKKKPVGKAKKAAPQIKKPKVQFNSAPTSSSKLASSVQKAKGGNMLQRLFQDPTPQSYLPKTISSIFPGSLESPVKSGQDSELKSKKIDEVSHAPDEVEGSPNTACHKVDSSTHNLKKGAEDRLFQSDSKFVISDLRLIKSDFLGTDPQTALILATNDLAPKTARHFVTLGLIGLGLLVWLLLTLTYIIFPTFVYFSAQMRRSLLFDTYHNVNPDLSNPASFGLPTTMDFIVPSDSGIRLGSWYTAGKIYEAGGAEQPKTPKGKCVIYLHDVGYDRGMKNRVKLIEVLSVQVRVASVVFDYRGYGDSTKSIEPSLEGFVNDTLAQFRTMKTFNFSDNEIVLWGHSVGAAVAVYAAVRLFELGESPAAVILESAFDDIRSVLRAASWLRLWRWMPCFEKIFIEPMYADHATAFDPYKQASRMDPKVPVLFLHSEDDGVVPYSTGKRLRDAVVGAREKKDGRGPVTFITFKGSHNYGHENAIFHPKLSEHLKNFLASSSDHPMTDPPPMMI